MAVIEDADAAEDAAFDKFIAMTFAEGLPREMTPEERAKYKEDWRKVMAEESAEKAKAAADKAAAEKRAKQAADADLTVSKVMSKLVPMVVIMGAQVFNIDELGYTRYVEIGFVVVQLICLRVLASIYIKIKEMTDDGTRIETAPEELMGKVVKPKRELTAKEYDMEQLISSVKTALATVLVVGVIYQIWGVIIPLLIQALLAPLQLFDAPLTQIHLLGKKKHRPFGSLPPEEPKGEDKKED